MKSNWLPTTTEWDQMLDSLFNTNDEPKEETKVNGYFTFSDSRDFVRSLNFSSREEFYQWHTNNKPSNIPFAAWRTYKNKGWNGWSDFLGYDPSMSSGERSIKKALDISNIKYEYNRSRPDMPHAMRFDFFLPEIGENGSAIEWDGIGHSESRSIWGGEEGLKRQQELDGMKDQYCKKRDILMYRVKYDDPEFVLD
jgi:hypothetical protein